MKNRAGYTLIELMVVVAIIAVMANAVMLQATDSLAVARDKRRMEDMASLRTAVGAFFLEHGHVPGVAENITGGSAQYLGVGAQIDSVLAPYLNPIPKDPRHDGTTYYYAYDPWHCRSNPPGDCVSCPADDTIATISAQTFEATDPTTLPRATCAGNDLSIDQSQYNLNVGPGNM